MAGDILAVVEGGSLKPCGSSPPIWKPKRLVLTELLLGVELSNDNCGAAVLNPDESDSEIRESSSVLFRVRESTVRESVEGTWAVSVKGDSLRIWTLRVREGISTREELVSPI